MSKSREKSVLDQIRQNFEGLTKTERQLANSLIENYPVSCLASITVTADAANVSTPTVLRMVKKLGYKGFPDFQAAVRAEVQEKISNPINKFDRWSVSESDAHILNKFAEATMENLKKSLTQIDPALFDAVVNILTKDDNALFIVGGRITRALSDYLFTHMQVARDNVTHMASNSNTWPHYILNMQAGDVLIAFDVRRYEHTMLNLTALAKERGVRVVLFTDQWGSPAAKNAEFVFNLRIEVPSAWDSAVVTVFFIEALISEVQAKTWDKTRARMTQLEHLFDATKLFKKFRIF